MRKCSLLALIHTQYLISPPLGAYYRDRGNSYFILQLNKVWVVVIIYIRTRQTNSGCGEFCELMSWFLKFKSYSFVGNFESMLVIAYLLYWWHRIGQYFYVIFSHQCCRNRDVYPGLIPYLDFFHPGRRGEIFVLAFFVAINLTKLKIIYFYFLPDPQHWFPSYSK